MPITLGDADLCLDLDPEHGFEVVQIWIGAQAVLAEVPWPRRSVLGPTDEQGWTHAWQGGWQVLLPNAGDDCVVEGESQGFHGLTAVVPWDVVSLAPRMAHARTRVGGVLVDRTVSVERRVVTVRTTVFAETGPCWLIPTEHLILGDWAVGDEVNVVGRWRDRRTLLEAGQPGRRETNAASGWGRLEVAIDVAEPLVVSSPDLSIRLDWDRETLPHCWLWTERGGEQASPFDGQVRCLGVEPSRSSQANGLEAARDRGEAAYLVVGDRLEWWASVTLAAEDLERQRENGEVG